MPIDPAEPLAPPLTRRTWRARIAHRTAGLGAPALLAPPAAFLVLFFFYPLARTLTAPSLEAWDWFTTPYVQDRLRIALVQAVLSVLLTLALALPLAWHHHRRALPFSRMHLAFHAAPFVLPVFVVVFGLRELLGPTGFVAAGTGIDVLAAIGPLGAVVLAHAYYNYGFAARLIHAALERRPHTLEAAARTLGAPPTAAFARTTLRLLAPSLAAVALLVFLFAFTSFGVVLLLGGSGVATLETLLFDQLQGIRRHVDRAAVLGIVQLGINVLLLTAYLALRRREVRLPREVAPAPAPARGRDHAVAWGVLAVGLAPALAVLLGSFHVRGDWTLEAWRALLDASHPAHLGGFSLWRALDLSVFYATWSTGIALGLTLLLAYGLEPLGTWPRRLVEAVAALPLGTSSLLIGFGQTLAFGAAAAGTMLDLRGTRTIIVAAHALVAFPFTARALLPALHQHDRRLDHAAALQGAGRLGVIGRVHWPLLRPPLVVAAGISAAMSLGDFGASLLLMRRENMAISIWIEAHRGRAFDLLVQAQGTALTAILMVLVLVAYIGVERFRVRGTDL